MKTIGYLVPEFPGQTHNFFWRELVALEHVGVRARLVSTRPPPPRVQSTSWGAEATARTYYLFPPSPTDFVRVPAELFRHGLFGLARWLKAIVRSEGNPLRLAMLAMLGARLSRLARNEGWTHVHVHSCADAANIAMFAARLSGLTYSLTLHNPLSVYGRNQRPKWRHAAFAITITQRIRDEVERELAGFLPARVAVAPMGVEPARFQRSTPYVPYDGDGVLRVFCCGRLNPGKGHDHLVTAVRRLREDGFRVHLRIAGEDDAGGEGYRRVLVSTIRRLGIESNVDLLGAVPEEAVRAEIERAHVFALASLDEPLGVAIMEAMAMEIPVVATAAGGVPDLVTDGYDGVLVPPASPEALAAGIAKIARDPALAAEMSARGRRRILEGFTSDRSARLIAALLGASPLVSRASAAAA